VIKAVVFDIGETLLDDTREWNAWADWIGIPHHTLSAVVGAVVASGRDNREAFSYFKPGFDIETERQQREAAGLGQAITKADLYNDVWPALSALRVQGLWVGVAGNQTKTVGEGLKALGVPADGIATSAEWGVGKPNPEFFERVISFAGRDPNEILYVGDHRDYDIASGRQAGLHTALVRRGPWGHLWAKEPVVTANAAFIVDSLSELPPLLRKQSL
jgi:N-acetyl-D-muramate 6-phosphate phosphatase